MTEPASENRLKIKLGPPVLLLRNNVTKSACLLLNRKNLSVGLVTLANPKRWAIPGTDIACLNIHTCRSE